MSLALTERNRLATPVELSFTPPPSFEIPMLEKTGMGAQEGPPDFVLDARTLAQAHDDSPAALVKLAQAEQAIGDDEAAIAAARRALSLLGRTKDDAIAFAALQVLLGCGRSDLAAKAVSQIENAEVANLLQARLAIDDERLEDANELLGQLESPDAVAVNAWVQLELKNYEAAIRLFRRAIAKDGVNAPLLLDLGYAHAALGSRAKAIKVTRQAAALAPDNEAIGFNLVCFYVADRNLEAAKKELSRLRATHPTRLRFDLAEADLSLQAGNVNDAYATLRRARQSVLWAYAEPIELAELEANLAFVEWRLGQENQRGARRKVIEQLKRTDFRSLDIASMLPALLRMEDADEADALYDALARVHSPENLLFLKTRVAMLHADFRRAAECAVEWAEEEVFNAHAAAVAIHLLADVLTDFDRAVAIGERALQVAGGTDELVNNLAYACALGGRFKEARDVLRESPSRSPYLLATEGLVEILSGNIERGVVLYESAYELALEQSFDPELPAMVRLNEALALHRAGAAQGLDVALPDGWQGHPYWLLFKLAAERVGFPSVSTTQP
jgi:tetratricopeptide (TPR) repeat protein